MRRALVVLASVALGLVVCNLVALLTPLKSAQATFQGADGSITFQSYRDGNSEIYAMKPEDSNPTRLTNSAAWEGDSAFSPDGKRVAFLSDRDA